MKFDVGRLRPTIPSRCQNWKYQASPAPTATLTPDGVGIWSRFTLSSNEPAGPVFRMLPPTTRPMLPPRQMLPVLLPGFATKPWVSDARLNAKAFVGRFAPASYMVRAFMSMFCAVIVPATPVELMTALQ